MFIDYAKGCAGRKFNNTSGVIDRAMVRILAPLRLARLTQNLNAKIGECLVVETHI